MSIRLFLIAFVFLPGTVLAQDQSTDTEPNPLDVFSGFIGPTWRADVSPVESEEKVYDVSQWEWILGGKAIRIRHSVADGAYAGETLLTWDERSKTIAYFYATTGGFFTRGSMNAEKDYYQATEIVVGNAGGKVGLRSAGEILEDGSMRVVSSSRTRSGWSEPDTTIYVPAPEAKIVIPTKPSSN